MMGIRAAAVVVAVWIALPGPAEAADVQVSLGGGVEWDSNVERRSIGADDDFIFQVRPKLRFLEDQGKATWDIHYQPTYEKAVDSDLVDDIRHYLAASGGYHFNEATEFFFSDRLRLSDSINTLTDLDDISASTISSRNEPVLRNSLNAGVRHRVTPRLAATAAFSSSLFRSDLVNRSDTQTYGGNLNLQYAYSPRHTFGAGVSATQQDFEASPNGRNSASDNLFVNLFATWSWMIDETTNFEIRFGPTFIDGSQEAPEPVPTGPAFPALVSSGPPPQAFGVDASMCPTVNGFFVLDESCPASPVITDADDLLLIENTMVTPEFAPGTSPASRSETAWNVFGEATLSKRWTPNLVSTLSYSRHEDTASGVGGSTILDYLFLVTSWRITELWDTSLRADWTKRVSTVPSNRTFLTIANEALPNSGTVIGRIPMVGGLTSISVKETVDTTRYGVAWRLTRRITQRLSVSTRYTFVRQESVSDTFGVPTDFNGHLVTLNVQYDFDRWTLW